MDWLYTVLIGLVATLAMTLTLKGIQRSGFAEADMITAIGSLFTKKEENAFGLGVRIHFLVGVLCALFYVSVWSLFSFKTLPEFIGVGALVGFAHGLVMSLLLVVSVAEHHPLERFRRAGLSVAMSHLVAHVVFGVVVGLGAAVTEARFDTVNEVASLYLPTSKT